MRFGYFFDGAVRSEETASAFLAMALDGVPRFRNHVLSLITPPNQQLELSDQDWRVTVEAGRFGVRLEAKDILILIEISTGTKLEGHLGCRHFRERKNGEERQIICVCLSPAGSGKDEVLSVTSLDEFEASKGDHVSHLSWEELFGYSAAADDGFDNLIANGLSEIKGVIEQARLEVLPLDGNRAAIRAVMDEAFGLLKQNTTVGLMRYCGQIEEIITNSTNVTLRIQAVFRHLDFRMRPAKHRLSIVPWRPSIFGRREQFLLRRDLD